MTDTKPQELTPAELDKLLELPAVYADRLYLQASPTHVRLVFGDGPRDTARMRVSVLLLSSEAAALRDMLIRTLGLPAEHRPAAEQVN